MRIASRLSLLVLICPASLIAGADSTPAANEAQPSAPVSFLNDVLPVLSKVGCNQGTCHGSASGKGGFKLSLRGFAPELDYPAIVREEAGRRVDLVEPQQSLILRKPTLAVPHQGGRVLAADSAAYQVILEWLRQGAAGPTDDDRHVIELKLEPTLGALEPGGEIQLRVEALLSDGSRRDVTEWARYDSNDVKVVAVDTTGQVRASGPGQAAVSASYQDQLAALEIAVPFAASASPRDYTALPRANYIDELVIDKWQQLRLWPSPLADDATFLRRVYLDITGTLPEQQAIEAFLQDRDAHKRQAVVDRLLDSPQFVDMWTQKWSDVLRVSREWITEKGVWTFHNYLRNRIARNVPWNEVVRELVAGVGDSTREGPPNYYLLQKVFNEAELWPLTAAETTAQTFLGVRIQCARCHNHPLDRWTQADYYGMASFFARVGTKITPFEVAASGVLFDSRSGEINHPRLGRPLPPKPLDGPVMNDAVTTGSGPAPSRRELLAHWITIPENPLFARATANRVWRHFMGCGLVEPVDDFRSSNPPTNGRLLDALARDLTEHRFDLKHLMRTILCSRVYQLASTATDENRGDSRFYSHYEPKRMTAEQILDALGQVTGLPEKLAGLPAAFRAQQLPDTKFASTFLDAFGRPLRRVASCECERVQEPNLAQALELMHSSMLHDRVTADGGLVERLIQAGATDTAVLKEIYLRCLGRPATAEEAQALLGELPARSSPTDTAGQRREVFEDLLWAIVNSKEFLFNH